MTKKIFAMFLAVLMVVSMLPTTVFAANCPGAGKHTANNSDCTVIAVTEPTCGAAGFTTYKCNICKETFADNYKAATGEHSMVAGEAKTPTCGVAGYEAGTECENCDLVIPGAPIAPVVEAGISCEYKDMTPDIDCTTGGVKTFECVVCAHTYTKKIEKIGEHTWQYDKLYVISETVDGKAGLAGIPCELCSAVKEIEWFGNHSCAETVQFHKEVAATCTTPGEIAHYECRVCGKLFGLNIDGTVNLDDVLRANEWADGQPVRYNGHGILTVFGHTPKKHDATECDAQEVECSSCNEKYTLTLGHNYVGTVKETAATCITPGHISAECTRCGEPYHETIPALGHISKTVTVPATCGTYAYTFTYCMNEACKAVEAKYENMSVWFDTKNVEYDLSVGYTVADTFIAYTEQLQVVYNLSLYHTYYDAPLYLTGNMNGYYFETSDEAADAAEVKLENVYDYKGDVVENAFYLNVGVDANGEKQYIQIYERFDGDYGYGSYKPAVAYVGADEASVFVLNEELGLLTVTLDYGEYFLNTYKDKVTVGASSIEYATSSTTYPIVLSYITCNGVDLVAAPSVDVKAGYNADNHNLTYEVYKYPSCSEEGSVLAYCFNHNCTYSAVLPMEKDDHYYVNLENGNEAHLAMILEAGFTATLNTISVEETCTKAGYKFRVCYYCGKVDKKIIDADGHYFETKWKPKYEAADHDSVGGQFYECKNKCGERYYLWTESWKGANETWETIEEAFDMHDDKLINKTLYRDGDCETLGLWRFFCTGCEKFVYAKQWKTLYEIDKDGKIKVDANGDPIPVIDKVVKRPVEYVTGQHPAKPFLAKNDEGVNTWHVDPAMSIYYDNGVFKAWALPYYQAPTCEKEGKLYSYECYCCGETIGEAPLGDYVKLDKVDHYWDTPTYIDSDTNPCPNGVPYTCLWCGLNRNVFDSNIGSSNLCEDLHYELYMCSCGEEHIRGLYGAFGHEFVTCIDEVKPTHFTTGYKIYKCTFCDETKKVTLGKTPHMNAAEEEFTDKCTDTVTDRHCVLCCQCTSKGTKHDCHTCDENNDRQLDCTACMIFPYHHWKVAEVKPSTCTMMPYQVLICGDCGLQILEVETSFLKENVELVPVQAQDENGNLVWVTDANGEFVLDDNDQKIPVISHYAIANESEFAKVETKDNNKNNTLDVTAYNVPTGTVDFKGHKPAEVDYLKDENGKYVLVEGEKVEVRYANYIYVEDYEWTSYKWVLVSVPYVKTTVNEEGYPVYETKYSVEYRLVETVETYTAKFMAYEPKTYATDGYEKMDCQICKAEVEQTMPKKTGIGFEMDFANANGAKGYGFGSLVEVTVSVNSLTSSIYGFEFEVKNNKDMVFVGYEVVNENFALTVTDPEVAVTDGLKIVGHAVNTVDGKMQNIAITEKTPLVKLFFRAQNAGKTTFWFDNENASKVVNAAAKALSDIDANYEEAKITVRGMLDFNKDGSATTADLYQAMTLLTGEHPNGLTYDVTVDLNKDGEVTLEDLSIGYDFMVGNVTEDELLKIGMSGDEIELFMYIKGLIQIECVHCDTVVGVNDAYCSNCGRYPHAK